MIGGAPGVVGGSICATKPSTPGRGARGSTRPPGVPWEDGGGGATTAAAATTEFEPVGDTVTADEVDAAGVPAAEGDAVTAGEGGTTIARVGTADSDAVGDTAVAGASSSSSSSYSAPSSAGCAPAERGPPLTPTTASPVPFVPVTLATGVDRRPATPVVSVRRLIESPHDGCR